MLPSTIKVWIEAFTTVLGRADEELDAPRIKAAFKTARHTLTAWPMPAQIIDLMPRRPEQKKILYDPAADPGYAKEAFQIALDLAAGRITQEEADKRLKRLASIG